MRIMQYVIIGCLLFNIAQVMVVRAELTMSVNAIAEQSVSLAVVMIIPSNASLHYAQELEQVATTIVKDLNFLHQCDASLHREPHTPSQTVRTTYASQYQLGLFLEMTSTHIIWRLYDLGSMSMIKGMRYAKRGRAVRGWGHQIADAVHTILTGQPGFFATRIAYCKQIWQPGQARPCKQLYVADYDGSNEEMVAGKGTIIIAPRWNKDVYNPLLFFSQATNYNTPLMAIDTKKRKRIVVNFDGTNMLPSFNPEGSQVLFCATRGQGSAQLFLFKEKDLQRLTLNEGNNISPLFSGDPNTIFFCSDALTKRPQIYTFELSTKKIVPITNGGYCVCPAYCARTNTLVYCKMVQGVLQLMLYDCTQATHRQVTWDEYNKQEPSWSPCGNYIVCAMSNRSEQRIGMVDIRTGKSIFLTPIEVRCTYPDWSIPYHIFPSYG
jgi:TolB protein